MKKKIAIIVTVVILIVVTGVVVSQKRYPEFSNSEIKNYIPQDYIAYLSNGWEDSDCYNTYLYVKSNGKVSYITTYEPVNVMGSYGNTKIIRRKLLRKDEDILKEIFFYRGEEIDLGKAYIKTNIDFKNYKRRDRISSDALSELISTN